MKTTKTAFLFAFFALFCLFSADLYAENDNNWQKYLQLDKTSRYYGLYFQGNKVGWMSEDIKQVSEDYIGLKIQMEFSFRVGGSTNEMKYTDIRRYDYHDGELFSIDYKMKGSTGKSEVSVKRAPTGMDVVSKFGGRVSKSTIPFNEERLQDLLAMPIAIKSGKAKPGFSIKCLTYDPGMMTTVTTTEKFITSEKKVVNGIKMDVHRTEGVVEEVSIPVVHWFDKNGRVLEMLIAGFLSARWEDEKTAKSGLSMADFINASIVPVPKLLKDSKNKSQLSIIFAGVADNLKLNDDRQKWQTIDDFQKLVLTKEKLDLAKTVKLKDIKKSEFKEFLAATERLQTGDPAIKKVADKLRKSSKTSGELAKKILEFTYAYIDKEFTPTFSNASEVMASKKGDCGEHSVLFVAISRAAGLPAREVTGVVYSDEVGGFGFHAWSEVWLGRWISIDPSWNQFPADPTHIAFSKGGIADQVKIVPLIGTLRIRQANLK